MKTITQTTLAYLFMIIQNVAQGQYYTQYFDGEDTLCSQTEFYASICVEIEDAPENIWQIGVPQKTYFDSPATVPNVIITDTVNHYPPNNTSSFQFYIAPNNFTPWGILAIQWKQKIDFQNGADGGLVEFSTDHGNTWHSAFNNPFVYNFYGYEDMNENSFGDGQYGFTGLDTVWRDIWLCYDFSWSLHDTIYVRMTLVSDSEESPNEGWIIDNLMAHITWVHTVEEFELDSYMTIFPSPTSDFIFIETQKIQEYHIIEQLTLVNSVGQIVDEWFRVPTKFFIDAKKYPNGTYFITAQTNKKTVTTSVVINHD